MSYTPRFDVEITVGVDLEQVIWPASAVQYGYDNNRSYINFRNARWRDVDQLIATEQRLLARCLTDAEDAEDFELLWERAGEAFEPPDEQDDFPDLAESAYSLDFGTAAATLALNAAGCPTIMACSGHQTGYPYIAFWLPVVKLPLLEEAAREAGIGLGNAINGAVEVYSDAPDGLLRFAMAMRRRSAGFRQLRSERRVSRRERRRFRRDPAVEAVVLSALRACFSTDYGSQKRPAKNHSPESESNRDHGVLRREDRRHAPAVPDPSPESVPRAARNSD